MTASVSGVADLRALATLIQISIDDLEDGLIANGKTFPSLATLFDVKSEEARTLPHAQTAIDSIVAAASQLIAMTRPPLLTLMLSASQFHVSTALRTAIQAHVPEILKSAGAESTGMHVKDIAAFTGVNAPKLARILRILATHHIFREVSPDVFTHNRLSSTLDTGKSIKEILSDPDAKHDNTSGFSALVEHVTDEAMKSSAYIPEALLDPKFTNSAEPNEVGLNLAFNTNLGAFPWLELPENSYRLRRFGLAMRGGHQLLPKEQAHVGFDWAGLPQGSVVVDVGGGIGSQTLALVKAHAHLQYVVQDRSATIEDAKMFWESQYPEVINSGQVKLEVHNFFEPQVQFSKPPAIFFLRYILHDWADAYCIKILQHLRAAAGPDTKLIVTDSLIPYACAEPSDVQNIPGAAAPPVPPDSPLLIHQGVATARSYIADMTMLAICNGQERTALHFSQLFEQTGWKLLQIFRQGVAAQVVGVPV